MNNTLQVLQIVPGTSVDGPGLRTSVYFAGCSHHCPGCHNPASWNFDAGEAFDPDKLADIVIAHGFNVTLTGGDPLQHRNLDAMRKFIARLKAEGLKIWCYTGYTFDEITARPELASLIQEFDAIVEGRYIDSERDLSLHFRGSRNQRILRPDGTPYPLSRPEIRS